MVSLQQLIKHTFYEQILILYVLKDAYTHLQNHENTLQIMLLSWVIQRAVDRVWKKESSLTLCAAEYWNLMDLWVRFMAAHPLHCYRRERVDWSSPTPETIIHSPPRSILSSQSTSVSIGLLFLGQWNVCQDQGHTVFLMQCDDYFGLRWRSISCLFFAYAWEMDC